MHHHSHTRGRHMVALDLNRAFPLVNARLKTSTITTITITITTTITITITITTTTTITIIIIPILPQGTPLHWACSASGNNRGLEKNQLLIATVDNDTMIITLITKGLARLLAQPGMASLDVLDR